MVYTRAGWMKPTFFTNTGEVAAGYQLFTYDAGTTTKRTTYSNATGTTNTNPIILDVAGRCDIFQPPLSMKYVLALPTDSDPPLAPVWTSDENDSIPADDSAIEISGMAGENMTAGQVCYLSDGSGSLTAGRWYLASAGAYYSSAGAQILAFATSDTLTGARATFIRLVGRVTGLVGLTTGSTYYVSATPGALTATEPVSGTPRRVIGIADSTTSLVITVKTARERVHYSTALVGNVGGGEDTLGEYIAPAGELNADGASYRLRAWGLTANNANAKTLTVRVIEGANNNVLIAASMTTGAVYEWVFEADILRSAATKLGYFARVSQSITNTLTGTVAINVDREQTATWANAVTIRVAGTGVANDDIFLNGIEVYRID